jgi:hypothetical protein
MHNKLIFKILDKQATEVVQIAMLLSENKEEAEDLIHEILDEALRQLWRLKD